MILAINVMTKALSIMAIMKPSSLLAHLYYQLLDCLQQ